MKMTIHEMTTHEGYGSRRLHGLDQSGQEGGSAGQLRDQDVLVRGVGSVTYSAETVEGWDAQTGGEIAIGAAAYRGFA